MSHPEHEIPPRQGIFDPLSRRDETGAAMAAIWQRYEAAKKEITGLALEAARAGQDRETVRFMALDRLLNAQEDCAQAQKLPVEQFRERFDRDAAELIQVLDETCGGGTSGASLDAPDAPGTDG